MKQDEIDVLGARVSGAVGRISLPQTVVEQLIALWSLFCRHEPRTIVQGQIVLGSSFAVPPRTFLQFFQFLGLDPPRGRAGHRTLFSESMVEDILPAILFLPVCVADLRAKISSHVVATDASEWRLGVFTCIFVIGATTSCIVADLSK